MSANDIDDATTIITLAAVPVPDGGIHVIAKGRGDTLFEFDCADGKHALARIGGLLDIHGFRPFGFMTVHDEGNDFPSALTTSRNVFDGSNGRISGTIGDALGESADKPGEWALAAPAHLVRDRAHSIQRLANTVLSHRMTFQGKLADAAGDPNAYRDAARGLLADAFGEIANLVNVASRRIRFVAIGKDGRVSVDIRDRNGFTFAGNATGSTPLETEESAFGLARGRMEPAGIRILSAEKVLTAANGTVLYAVLTEHCVHSATAIEDAVNATLANHADDIIEASNDREGGIESAIDRFWKRAVAWAMSAASDDLNARDDDVRSIRAEIDLITGDGWGIGTSRRHAPHAGNPRGKRESGNADADNEHQK